jgi:Protein of unknown function (DUF3987)
MDTENDSLSLSVFKTDIEEKINHLEPDRFPIDAFPKGIQNIIEECERTLNYPKDYLGASILYAASVAIGNTYWVEVKKGFQTNAVLYMAIVGRTGSTKSHPLNFATKPIYDRDAISNKEYKKELVEFQANQSLQKKDREKLGIEKIALPIYKKFICQDYTPESLAEIHDFNQRGIGVCVDELAGWLKNFGRYNKGSEMEFWLSNWSKQPLVVDRKGGDKVFISDPFISVVGGLQTGILDILIKEGRDQNGFIDRILFTIPDDMSKKPWNENELDELYPQRYERAISKLLNLSETNREVLKFSVDGKKRIFQWQNELTNLVNESPDSLRGPLSKMDIYAPRMCLIIQMLRWACDEAEKNCIDIQSVEAGLKLIEYFKKTATKVNRYLHTSPVERLPENIRDWYNSLPANEVKTSDAVSIGTRLGMSERNIKNYLAEPSLFRYLAYGKYSKITHNPLALSAFFALLIV